MSNHKRVLLGLIFALHAFDALASRLKDPTKPPGAMAAKEGRIVSSGDLLLTSIVISQRNRRAVINGAVVKTGVVLGGEMVTAISKNWVELSQNGQRRKVFLIPLKIKKTVN